MTEQEWLRSTDPKEMLEFVTGTRPGDSWEINHHRPTDRQLRLLACVIARESRLEDFPDDPVVLEDCECNDRSTGEDESLHLHIAMTWITYTWRSRGYSYMPPPERKAELVREVMGNPFRQDLKWAFRDGGMVLEHIWARKGSMVQMVVGKGGHPAVLQQDVWRPVEWITPEVTNTALGIYEDYSKGCLQDLPVLADLLEDSGCRHERLLMHLRGYEDLGKSFSRSSAYPMVHYKGCWAMDVVLGGKQNTVKEPREVMT